MTQDPRSLEPSTDEPDENTIEDQIFPPGHANPTGAAVAGGVTGAAIGAIGGPVGAIAGALGGAAVGAATERLMHVDDDTSPEWVAPSAAEGADQSTLLAVEALAAESQHEHHFVNGVCECGAEENGAAHTDAV